MIIFPAIDIKDGKVVRLLQGKFDKITEYYENPIDVAKQWQLEGAEWLHLVDLDGAKEGYVKNFDVICQIAKEVNIPIEVGGGIRSEECVEKLIKGGAARVILGTKAVSDRGFLNSVLDQWSDKIAVSLDCYDGFIADQGWTNTTSIKAVDFIKDLEELGLTYVVYTDIARDGMLTGPNFEQLEAICQVSNINIIASGGISNLDDIKQLKTMENSGIIGAITGKAIYEKTLDLAEAIKAAKSV